MTYRKRKSRLAAAIAVLTLVVGTAGVVHADYSTQAAELARLRSEVETLDQQIEDEREETRARLRALAQQKASLEGEVAREELRLKQLEQAIEKVQKQVREAGEMQRSMKPAVLEAIGAVEQAVKAGLPFRTEERTADLVSLKKELTDDVILPAVALSRLWNRVEDELRLTRENGLYQQVIVVDGEEVLADVARIGMVMLFFRTPDQRFGRAVRAGAAGTADGWAYHVYSSVEDRRRSEALFDALEKRVRVGFFELPNALPTPLPEKEVER